jgi:uncharacterized OB-fold protein
VSAPETSPKPQRFEPQPTDVTLPFWDATRDQQLLLQWCTACNEPIFFPRAVCPSCLGTSLEWRPASGRGSVYAVTVDYRPQLTSRRADEPFAVVLVTLEEGVRMVSNVVGCAPEEVMVGMEVVVTWEPLSDGRHLPQFSPA